MNAISIIGAGIGGLTLANVLKQQHLDFTRYDHATTPNMGQGACQAIEDSYIIGQLMKTGQNMNAVFRKFQLIRQKKVDPIVRTSWHIGKLSQWEKGNALRNLIMRLIPQKINHRLIEKIIRLEQ